MAELITATARLPGACRIDGLTVLELRTLPGDSAAQPAMREAGLPWVEEAGGLAGSDPFVAWRAPRHWLLLGRNTEPLQLVQAALAPGRCDTALAVDHSEAAAVIELHGPALDDWLSHLLDADAIPRAPGRASCGRLVDVPVLLLRMAGDRLWLVVDRPLLSYVIDWLDFAHEGASAGTP